MKFAIDPRYTYAGYLVNAFPPTFLPDLFETLHVVLSRSDNVHDVCL